MKANIAAYGGEIDVGPLETALYQGVAGDLDDVTAKDVAEELCGCHGVPSDGFYAAYDAEVAELRERFLSQRELRNPDPAAAGEPRSSGRSGRDGP